MLINLLLILAALVAVVLVIAALRSPEFRVARSISVSAPPALAFVQVNDLNKWQEMSPYVKMDPAAAYVFAGPIAGTGAALAWVGKKVGEGRMTITDSRPHELIRMRLDFLKPFAATHAVEFTFKTEGNQTVVTWSMSGSSNFIYRVVGIFMNMDKMVGGQFAEGLANLKALAEAAAKK